MDGIQIQTISLLSVLVLLFVLFCSTASAVCSGIYDSEAIDNCLDPQLVPNQVNQNIIMLIESEVERDDCTLPPTVPPTTPSKPQDTTPPPTEPSTQSPVTDAATTPQTTKPSPSTEPSTSEATTPEATTPEATTLEATTPEPEATTPEATTPSEATTPEATTPEATTPQPGTNGTFQNPASSCKYIPAGSPSGLYWINGSESATQQYCDMSRSCCGSTGGWMRVVDIDMTVPSQQCPSGFQATNSGSLRSCLGSFGKGCSTTLTFALNSIEYTRVCGRIIGYQYGATDAFRGGDEPITASYVDGISLTYGSPRNHIWTFAAAVNEIDDTTRIIERCPCTNPNLSFPSNWVPSFVGQDYFCDTGGGNTTSPSGFLGGNALWDGQGCSSQSTCCTRNNPPWFCKQLSSSTRDDINFRLCHSLTSEHTPFQILEIYVQ